MAIKPDLVVDAATNAVLTELLKVYDNVNADDVRPFARAVAEAARVAVEHVASNAVTAQTGERIN